MCTWNRGSESWQCKLRIFQKWWTSVLFIDVPRSFQHPILSVVTRSSAMVSSVFGFVLCGRDIVFYPFYPIAWSYKATKKKGGGATKVGATMLYQRLSYVPLWHSGYINMHSTRKCDSSGIYFSCPIISYISILIFCTSYCLPWHHLTFGHCVERSAKWGRL